MYKFDCGCTFKTNGGDLKDQDGIPSVVWKPTIENVNELCDATWNLLKRGRTKGIFQLEGGLGGSWAKKLQPTSIEDLGVLLSLIRPGCIKVKVDGKNMAQHYVDRKFGREPVHYVHDCVEDILRPTYGVLVYQEQSMAIASVVAGFSLKDADSLRKAIGKKKADLMEEVKIMFLKGAKEKGLVDDDKAEEIFGWIEKSNRYAFNKSHAIAYGMSTYVSAYWKEHFPLSFYGSCLFHSGDAPYPDQEVKELVYDGRMGDISTVSPNISRLGDRFHLNKGIINFGLSDLKKVGLKKVQKFRDTLETMPGELSNLSWYEFLTQVSGNVSCDIITSLISTGAMSHHGLSRKEMLAEVDVWTSLTSKERGWIIDGRTEVGPNNLQDGLKQMVSYQQAYDSMTPKERKAHPSITEKGRAIANKKRVDIIRSLHGLLENPMTDLEDYPEWIVEQEQYFMGVPITYAKVDCCDTTLVDTSCKEFFDGKPGLCVFGVEVMSCREYTITQGKSSGQSMAFLQIEDGSGYLDSVIAFTDQWKEFKNLLYEGNTVLLGGSRSDKDDDTLVIQKVRQI